MIRMQTSRRHFIALGSAALAAAALPAFSASSEARWPVQRLKFAQAARAFQAIVQVQGPIEDAWRDQYARSDAWHAVGQDEENWELLLNGLIDAKRGDIVRFGNPLEERFVHLPLSYQDGVKREPEEDGWFAVLECDGYPTARPEAIPGSGEAEVSWASFLDEAVSRHQDIAMMDSMQERTGLPQELLLSPAAFALLAGS